MADIEVYRDYTFMDDGGYKWILSVEDDFTYIRYHDYEDNKWKQKDKLILPTTFAYEIAKKIIEEYERKNKIITQQKEFKHIIDSFKEANSNGMA